MEVNALRSQVEGMEARYPSLTFQYSDPERGFDRRKVHKPVWIIFGFGRNGPFTEIVTDFLSTSRHYEIRSQVSSSWVQFRV